MRILITGGTGTIGRRLVAHLIKHGHALTVVSRQPYRPASLPAKLTFVHWDGRTTSDWGRHVAESEAIVNLAGAGLADARWTDKRKRIIQESRVQAGQAVVEAVRAAQNKPKVLIQSSAIDYYGAEHDDEVITEESGPGHSFLAEVCQVWEDSTRPVTEMGVRRVIIRTAAVLDPLGGAFPKLVLPFRFFVGGRLGSGQQWFSWIHYFDAVEAIRFLIENEAAQGPFNLAAPSPVKNQEFTRTLGQVMKRPAFMVAPSFALNLLLGELATTVLEGQRAMSVRLPELGFAYQYPQLDKALTNVVNQYYLGPNSE
jgi:uncharacterized protein (TIGR01777 family)